MSYWGGGAVRPPTRPLRLEPVPRPCLRHWDLMALVFLAGNRSGLCCWATASGLAGPASFCGLNACSASRPEPRRLRSGSGLSHRHGNLRVGC